MKHHGNRVEFHSERIAALLAAYDSALRLVSTFRLRDICVRIASLPSPRFWVSSERAMGVLAAMLARQAAGRPPLSALRGMRPNKRDMFAEIFSRVSDLMAANPSLSLRSAAEAVILQQAPSFYLSPSSIYKFIAPHRRQWALRKMRKWHALR